MTDTPMSDTKPIADETLKSRPEKYKRQHAAADREWNAGERQQTVAQRIEQAVEQNQDQARLIGTITSRRAFAFCRSSNSPAQTMR